jgi:hypothetical protein
MGQIVKQMSNQSTRYYWYPGDKKEWLRGAGAIAAGAIVYAVLHLVTRGTLMPAVLGTSVTAAMAGLNFGRRDSRELARFAELAKTKPARRQTAVHTGHALWRGLAEGTGGAAAAVLIVNLSQRGVMADWLLPLVPAAVGALAHQIGGMYEHLGTSQATDGPAKRRAEALAAARAKAAAQAGTDEPVIIVPDLPPAPVPAASVPVAPVLAAWVPATPAPAAPVPAAPVPAAPVPAAPVPAASVPATPEPAAPVPVVTDRKARHAAPDGPPSLLPRSTVAVSHLHPPVLLPPDVSTFTKAKPLMPLSAALAARKDVAGITTALEGE